MVQDAYIYSGVRTPVGKIGGALAGQRPAEPADAERDKQVHGRQRPGERDVVGGEQGGPLTRVGTVNAATTRLDRVIP